MFSPSQKKRLRQIQLRFLIHHKGFYQTLSNPTVLELLGTPPLDEESFDNRQNEIADSVSSKNRELATEVFDDWLSDLNDDDREVVKKRWGRILKGQLQDVMLVDEFTATAVYLTAKQEAYPQNRSQKDGIEFPIIREVSLISIVNVLFVVVALAICGSDDNSIFFVSLP